METQHVVCAGRNTPTDKLAATRRATFTANVRRPPARFVALSCPTCVLTWRGMDREAAELQGRCAQLHAVALPSLLLLLVADVMMTL